MTTLTSKTITALRFPLIVAVVLLHTFIIDRPIGGIVYVPSGKFPGFDWFEHIYRVELANISVPLFFLTPQKSFVSQIRSSWLPAESHQLHNPFGIPDIS